MTKHQEDQLAKFGHLTVTKDDTPTSKQERAQRVLYTIYFIAIGIIIGLLLKKLVAQRAIENYSPGGYLSSRIAGDF